MKSPWLVAVAALAIFALAACGGSGAAPDGAGTPTAAPGGETTDAPAPAPAATTAGEATAPAPSAAAVDVCALFSPAELKTATGKDYGAGVSDSIGCSWNVGESGVNQGELIYAIIQDQSLDFVKTSFTGGVDVTVAGHAGYWHPGQGLGSMWVEVDGRLFVLSFPRSGDLGPEYQAIAQTLAEIAVAKM